ncbi:hypothetical protein [Sphingomonas xanthus]|uniref:Uncharacterized protein n=1 Tax=Sphingomonas xanthus TaxID=2594473 RepID=A0A516IRP1_9SPHN|nr:hypothetical protein [Sphingomonas xanthus]QDP19567.1 hypothetical protein FMM02_06085 [Sphingomonas xanthus]
MMIGALFILAVAATAPPASPGENSAPAFRAVSGATARATVSIRVVNGASFGPNHSGPVSGAHRRSTEIADADGLARSAELLEFQ